MSMLAQRRPKQQIHRLQSYSNGNAWSNDPNTFGKKMLEKMGWSAGKGLGAKEDGMADVLRVPYKSDLAGVGFKESEAGGEQCKEFSELLRSLQESNPAVAAADEEGPRKIASLEEKSQSSRVRLHYKKFTRGKDLSRYSEKDLLSIFGSSKKRGSAAADGEVERRDHAPNLKYGGSMADYFRNKMAALRGLSNGRDAEETTDAGQVEAAEVTKNKKKKGKKRREEAVFDNPAFDVVSPSKMPKLAAIEDASVAEVKKKKGKKKKKKAATFENVAFQEEDENSEGSAAVGDDAGAFEVRRKTKKRGVAVLGTFENCAFADGDGPDEGTPVGGGVGCFEVKRKAHDGSSDPSDAREVRRKAKKRPERTPSAFDNSAYADGDGLEEGATVDNTAAFEIKRKSKRKKKKEKETSAGFDGESEDASAAEFASRTNAKGVTDVGNADFCMSFDNSAFFFVDREGRRGDDDANGAAFEVKRKARKRKSDATGVANPALEVGDDAPGALRRKKSVRFSAVNEERIIPNVEQQRRLEDLQVKHELFEINESVIASGLEEESVARRSNFEKTMESCQAEVENDLNEARTQRVVAADFF